MEHRWEEQRLRLARAYLTRADLLLLRAGLSSPDHRHTSVNEAREALQQALALNPMLAPLADSGTRPNGCPPTDTLRS